MSAAKDGRGSVTTFTHKRNTYRTFLRHTGQLFFLFLFRITLFGESSHLGT